MKCPNEGNGLGRKKVRLKHRLKPKPAKPCVITVTFSNTFGLEGKERSNIWYYNFLRKTTLQDRYPTHYTN